MALLSDGETEAKQCAAAALARLAHDDAQTQLAIGEAGAKNAGLLAAGILALHDIRVRKALVAFRKKQTNDVLGQKLP